MSAPGSVAEAAARAKLRDLDGQEIELASLWAEQPVVLGPSPGR